MIHVPLSLDECLAAIPVGAGEYLAWARPVVDGQELPGPFLAVGSHEPPHLGQRFAWDGGAWELFDIVLEGKRRGTWLASPVSQ